MQIHFSTNIDAPGRVHGAAPHVRSRAGADGASFDKSEALNKAMEEVPDVRADPMKRAGTAMAAEGYPPAEIVRKIAHLLALNIDSLSSETPTENE